MSYYHYHSLRLHSSSLISSLTKKAAVFVHFFLQNIYIFMLRRDSWHLRRHHKNVKELCAQVYIYYFVGALVHSQHFVAGLSLFSKNSVEQILSQNKKNLGSFLIYIIMNDEGNIKTEIKEDSSCLMLSST